MERTEIEVGSRMAAVLEQVLVTCQRVEEGV